MYIYIYIYMINKKIYNIYIYISRNGRFWGKINGKVNKSNTYNGFRCNISFFIQEIWRSSSLAKERNITTKPVVSVWFIYFSTYFHSIYIYIYISNIQSASEDSGCGLFAYWMLTPFALAWEFKIYIGLPFLFFFSYVYRL